GGDHAGAVGTDEAHAVLETEAQHEALDPHHVLGRDAVGYAHAQPDPGLRRLHDGIAREGWRHEHDACVRAGLSHCAPHGVEDRNALVDLPTLAWRDAAHNVGSVATHLVGMEAADLAGKALHDH